MTFESDVCFGYTFFFYSFAEKKRVLPNCFDPPRYMLCVGVVHYVRTEITNPLSPPHMSIYIRSMHFCRRFFTAVALKRVF